MKMDLFVMVAAILWFYCPLFTGNILLFNFQRLVTWEGHGYGFVITGRAETAAAQYPEPHSANRTQLDRREYFSWKQWITDLSRCKSFMSAESSAPI